MLCIFVKSYTKAAKGSIHDIMQYNRIFWKPRSSSMIKIQWIVNYVSVTEHIEYTYLYISQTISRSWRMRLIALWGQGKQGTQGKRGHRDDLVNSFQTWKVLKQFQNWANWAYKADWAVRADRADWADFEKSFKKRNFNKKLFGN